MKQIITNFNNTPEKISRISWGGVLAGTITILALLLLLNLFGTGVGIIKPSSVDDPFNYGGTVIWLIVSNLIAVFVGGFIAARTAGLSSSVDGGLHGFLAWALYVIVSLVFYTTFIDTDLSASLKIGAMNHNFMLFCVLLLGLLAGFFGGSIMSSVFTQTEVEKE